MLAIASYVLSSRIKVGVVIVYGPTREVFWNKLDWVVDRVGNGYRLCMVEDLAWVCERKGW